MQKPIRVTAIVLLGAFLVYAIASSSTNKPIYAPWNDAMTIGNKKTAEHHFVMYTDIFCPYCDKFSNAVTANQEKFEEEYIRGKNVLFEIRMTDVNYNSGHSNNSKPAAEGAYCAANQGKFWEYYHTILAKLYEEYHSKGIGVSRDSEHIPDLPMDYFYNIGEEAGLDSESFRSCLDNHETEKIVTQNTNKAGSIIGGGVPFFQFDKYTASGFAGNWDTDLDWQTAKTMLNAGLASK